MQKLPRKLDETPEGQRLWRLLGKSQALLWNGGQLKVAHRPLTIPLTEALSMARRGRQLRGGLEQISSILRREENGLRARKSAIETERISRLVLLSSDGSERFCRACETLLINYESRVLGVRLNITGAELGALFFGKETLVKIAMVEHKDFVVRALLAFLDEEGQA